MSKPAWEFEHSVECNAPPRFAWGYWTDVANWNDPPAKFHLDGPFEAGSRLMTRLPDQTWHSIIRDVSPGREATIEMQLQGAVLSFHWRFEEVSKERTRITQRLALGGANAKSFLAQVTVFEQSIPDGMKKVVAAIEGAQ
jgi:Polyketide cyclase / dehydrase and lipid transport